MSIRLQFSVSGPDRKLPVKFEVIDCVASCGQDQDERTGNSILAEDCVPVKCRLSGQMSDT